MAAPRGLGLDARDRVHRAVAAVVEQPADVVRVEHREQAIHRLAAVVVRQVETAGTEGPARGARQAHERRLVQAGGVDQGLLEHADDAAPGSENLADPARGTRGHDDRRGAGVDDGGDTAGVGIQEVLLAHRPGLVRALPRTQAGGRCGEFKSTRGRCPVGARPRRIGPGKPGRVAAYCSAAKALAVIASTAPRPEILRTLGALASPEAAHLL